jgi:hypothetical protein
MDATVAAIAENDDAAEVIQHIGARPLASLKELAKANGLPV